jgi:hypothetical protein
LTAIRIRITLQSSAELGRRLFPLPKSAVDVISTAFAYAADQLAEPFRMGQWARLALLALATGELSSSSGCSNVFHSFPSQFPKPSHSFAQATGWDVKSLLHSIDPALLVTMLLVLLVGGLVLILVWIFVASVSRFILFEAVLKKHCDPLGDGWRRWQGPGLKYFGWQLILFLISTAVAAVLFLPLLLPVLATIKGNHDVGPGIFLAFLPMILVFAAFSLVIALIHLFSKDFVVPLMALDGLGVFEAWKRLWAMIKTEPLSYAGYVGMKIVLAIGASVVFGILSGIAAAFVAVPFVVVAVAGVFMAKNGSLTWNSVTITVLVVLATIAITILAYVIALACVPVAVFFPAYAMYFFAERYPALHARLYPAPPMPPPTPATWAPAPTG